MSSKRIKDWATSITSFRSGDVIAVDGPSGTARMTKDNLLSLTAKNSDYTIAKVRTTVDVVEFVERNGASANLDVILHFNTSTYTSNMLMLISPNKTTINIKLTVAQQAAIVDSKLTIVVPVDQYLVVNSSGNLEVVSSINETSVVAARNVYGNFCYGFMQDLYNEFVSKTECKNASNFESGFTAETTGVDGTKVLTSLVSEFIDIHELANRRITVYRNSAGSSNVVIYNSAKEKVNYFGISENRTINLANVTNPYYIRFQFDQGADAYVVFENRVIWRASPKVGSIVPVEISKHPAFYTLCAVLNRVDCSFVERNQSNKPLDVVFTFKSTNEPYFFIKDDKGADKDIYLTNDQKGDIVGDKLTMSIPYGGSLVVDKNFNFAIRSSDANVEKYDIVMARNIYANFGYGAMQNLYENFKFNTIKPAVDVLQMYQDDEISVNAIARKGYGTDSNNDFCLELLTDTHNDSTSVERAIQIANNFNAVKAVLYLGDATASKYDISQVNTFMGIVDVSTKPFYFVTGNHDVGFEYGLAGTATQKNIYDSFIAPLVTKGWLELGEYIQDKAYYYHDFTDDKIRLICLYEYDVELKLEESVWEAVTYNSSYPNVVVGTTYSVGDYVNVEGYTAYSFKAKVNVDTTGGSVWNKDKLPSWTCPRGRKAIQKDQADWLAATLLSTPQDYRVIVALHNPFSATCTTDTTKLFCKDIELSGSSQILSVMNGNLIEDMIAAFIDGTTCSGQVEFTGDATYMNTEGGGTYAYNYAYDFSSKNTGVKFLNFIGGHAHADYIWKSATNEAIWQVSPMCNGFQQEYAADIRRNNSLTKYGRDSITCYAVNPTTNKVSVCKIGAKRVIDGRWRDYEILN